MAFDVDADACSTYERNLGVRPVRVDARDLVRMVASGWTCGRVDLLVMDPPCASEAWSDGDAKEKDGLEMLGGCVELVRRLRPRACLMANLPGPEDDNGWRAVQSEIGSLRRTGYCVVDCARLDAADYGAPQHRFRTFWFLGTSRDRAFDGPLGRMRLRGSARRRRFPAWNRFGRMSWQARGPIVSFGKNTLRASPRRGDRGIRRQEGRSRGSDAQACVEAQSGVASCIQPCAQNQRDDTDGPADSRRSPFREAPSAGRRPN